MRHLYNKTTSYLKLDNIIVFGKNLNDHNDKLIAFLKDYKISYLKIEPRECNLFKKINVHINCNDSQNYCYKSKTYKKNAFVICKKQKIQILYLYMYNNNITYPIIGKSL